MHHDHPHHDEEPHVASEQSETPRWWQTLEERAAPEAARAAARDEFAQPPHSIEPLVQLGVQGGSARRDFFRMMGLSAAAAMSACKRAPTQNVLPLTRKPDEATPGLALWYATTCGGCAGRCGLLVKVRDGRPIKIEGNPSHPVSQGAVCAVGQASVLGLYDADRAKGPKVRGRAAGFGEVDAAVGEALERAGSGGRAIRVVVPWAIGPTEVAALERFVKRWPTAKIVRFEALGELDGIADAHAALYGARVVPDYRFDEATFVASFGADFLGTWIAPAAFTRAWAQARDVDGRRERHELVAMARHVQVEGNLTVTGAAADERIIVRPSRIAAALAAVVDRLAKGADGEAAATANALVSASRAVDEGAGLPKDKLDALAEGLRNAGTRGLVVCGSSEPGVQALAAAANALLGNDATCARVLGGLRAGDGELTFAAFARELEAGTVGAALFLGTNPALVRPALASKIAALPFSLSTADRLDETASVCAVHAPESHWLESWGDAAPRAGVRSLAQPCVSPLFDTRGRLASILAWAGETTPDEHGTLRARWEKDELANQRTWEAALRDGALATAPAFPGARFGGVEAAKALFSAQGVAKSELELELYPSVGLRDGAPANNGWLQELPDPIAKTTWSNFVALAPVRADALGLTDGDVASVRAASGASVELPVVRQPGLADGVVAVALGFGRAKAGRIARGHGVDAWPLADWSSGHVRRTGIAVTLTKTGGKKPLAVSQTHGSQEGRELVRSTAVEAYLTGTAHGHAAAHEAGEHHDEGLWPKHEYKGHRWGLAVDLNACTGCGACVVSCQAENNVPVVGELEVLRRREMHWLRIDRYYGGDPGAPEVAHQPMMCQHCENAPCESVCPVLATVHSPEGLNQQVYNRCIGTRYCANNCPTKVRRFNWFEYTDAHGAPVNPATDDLARMVLNPDVVVRGRGVMEKCSLCVHRIEETRALTKREGRRLGDGDIQTACQQSCPAQAITFGDLNDPDSAVSRKAARTRSYKLLTELNIGPVVSYLARVTNRGHHG